MKTLLTLLVIFILAHTGLMGQTIEESAPLQLTKTEAADSTSSIVIPGFNKYNNGGNQFLAVPANDDCSNAIALTVSAPCVNGTTKQATKQGGENFGCQGTPNQSVWYKFVATATTMYVQVEFVSGSGCYFGSAVWSGSCLPSGNLSCIAATANLLSEVHNLTTLSIGTTYYIQVTYTTGFLCGSAANKNTGDNFCIEVGIPVNCQTCPSPCGPLCIFASQPTAPQVTSACTKYDLTPHLSLGQSKTECYTFKANSTTFNLQAILNVVGCPSSGGTVTTFNWTLQTSACGAILQSGTLSNLNATGLTINQNYVLCYTWVSACQYETAIYPYIVSNSPLPVEMIDFKGVSEKSMVRLNWTTASEINNNFFNVERAYQANQENLEFTFIGTVKGSGNSTKPVNYQFVDEDPFGQVNVKDEIYYRLKQTDFDGTLSYSPVIAVKNTNKEAIRIHPNPAKDQFTIGFSNKISQGEIEIYNPIGQIIYRQNLINISDNDELQIKLNTPNGIYFVKISDGTRQSLQILIIK